MTTLGQQIKALRTQAHLRLVDLQEVSGVSASTISLVERGDHVPALDLLARICRGLGVRVQIRLIKGEGLVIWERIMDWGNWDLIQGDK